MISLKPKGKIFIGLTFLLISFLSCKKTETTGSIQETVVPEKGVTLEKVDVSQLNKYINYEMALQTFALLVKNGIKVESNVPKMNKFEFEKMIDNYLANERNIMRQDYYRKKNNKSNIAARPLPFSEPNYIDNSQGVGCSGKISTTNSVGTVLFTAQMNGTTITKPDFGFGGVSGEWKEIGSISQEVYNDVTTYKQYFSESVKGLSGVTYTQLYVIYGNVYKGTCTVQGMQIVATN